MADIVVADQKATEEKVDTSEYPEALADALAEPPSVEELERVLLDTKEPVAKRNRSIFYLKQHNNEAAVRALAKGMRVKSTLLSHEAAYVLGQMQLECANPYLTAVLRDPELNPIVRHEAAEALAAIGSPGSLEVLREMCTGAPQEVTDTCHLAVARIEWAKEQQKKAKPDTERKGIFTTVDPAPAEESERSVDEHKAVLCNTQLSLFDRYRAMFSLRNINTKEAVLALAEGFADPSSAVFRHEIAYVMGQMQHEASVPSLLKVLQDTKEHSMVRHEAAEALGAIGNTQCLDVLSKFQSDEDIVVKQSCDVALDIADYWNSDDQM